MGLSRLTGQSNYKKRAQLPEMQEAMNALGIKDYKGSYSQNVAIEKYLKSRPQPGAAPQAYDKMLEMSAYSDNYRPSLKEEERVREAQVGDPSLWGNRDWNPKPALAEAPTPSPASPSLIPPPMPGFPKPRPQDAYPHLVAMEEFEGIEEKDNVNFKGPEDKVAELRQRLIAQGYSPAQADAYCNYFVQAGVAKYSELQPAGMAESFLGANMGNTVRSARNLGKSGLWQEVSQPQMGDFGYFVDNNALNSGGIRGDRWYPGHSVAVWDVSPDGGMTTIEGNSELPTGEDGIWKKSWTPEQIKQYEKEKNRTMKFYRYNSGGQAGK